MQSQLLSTTFAAPPPGNEDGVLLAVEKREDLSEGIINLDLGIGRCACADGEGVKGNNNKIAIKQEKNESFFTAVQFCDFYNQVLVYNCITSGLPVPLHLFLPIWMSVCNSFGPAVCKNFPSFIGFTSPRKPDRNKAMDIEPGRCRRTDGRKWRCSKNTIPNQKYCERHMHRGRYGSRKRVEPNESFSRPDNKNSTNNQIPIISSMVPSCPDNRIPLPAQNDLDQIQTQPGKKRNHADEGEESNFENAKKFGGRKCGTVKNSFSGFISPKFGSSPKSVLQCGAGKAGPVPSDKNVTEKSIPQRCRRTDGKKWQCGQDALPNQKYCQRHMHRGAKRLTVLNPKSACKFRDPCAQKVRTSCTVGRTSLDCSINLNAIPKSPLRDNSTSSSSSDATTITDENISFRVAHSLTN